MPTIIAAKAGTCTAAGCSGRILKGEYVEYSAATGTRHLVCASAEQGRRPNLRAGLCRLRRPGGPSRGFARAEGDDSRDQLPEEVAGAVPAVRVSAGQSRSSNSSSACCR
ncbi:MULTISPECIES: hypothetical protein [Corallococcus]|uniref:hypothetical protein n=1 Tax=Corallococcus TaxID=83461 RepID=UPI001F3C351E|nr:MULTISPECIES: hypothetical protein [Corallococcus]